MDTGQILVSILATLTLIGTFSLLMDSYVQRKPKVHKVAVLQTDDDNDIVDVVDDGESFFTWQSTLSI